MPRSKVFKRQKSRRIKSKQLRKTKEENSILIKIFNEAITYDGIHEDDIITRKESENRILWCLVFLQVTLAMVASCLILSIAISLISKETYVLFTPNVTESMVLYQGFPTQHVALVFQDGSIYDVSLNETVSASKHYLIKLQADDFIFGFSNPKGALQLISSSLCRKITKYHQQYGHEAIANSFQKNVAKPGNQKLIFDCSDYLFTQGIQVGNMFWIWGQKLKAHWDQLFQEPLKETYIYFWKRDKWIEGPMLLPGTVGPWSSAAINATTAMMVLIIQDPLNLPLQSIVYDFELEQWINFPKFEQIDFQADNTTAVWQVSLTVLISKHNRKAYCACLFRNLWIDMEGYKLLLSYDLDEGPSGKWITEMVYDEKRCKTELRCYAKIIAIQGLLYSFDNENPHESSGSVYQNGSWQKLDSVVPLEPNTSAPIPVYIIPYYVRKF